MSKDSEPISVRVDPKGSGAGTNLRRRDLPGAALAALGTAGLGGCGGGGGLLGPEEGEDVFTFDVKLLNAAVTEEAVTVSSGSKVYFDNLAYGQVGSVQLKEDDFGFNADLTVKGLTSGTETVLKAVPISPACFILLSSAPSRYSMFEIGGVPSPYSSLGDGPNSSLYHVTQALGEIEVFALEGTGTQLPSIGRLKPVGPALAIPPGAVAAYKLVFVENGSTIYASGPREKPAHSLLLIMRTAPLADPASTWGVFLVDSNYTLTQWKNTHA